MVTQTRMSGVKAKELQTLVAQSEERLLRKLRKLMRAGRLEESIVTLDALLEMSPRSLDYLLWLGDACLRLRNFDRAIKAFSAALAIDSRSPDTFIGMGLAMHEFKQFEGAAASFEIAALYDPANHMAIGYRALSLVELGRVDLAVDLWSQAMKLAPDNPVHLLNRGRMYSGLGFHDKAAEDFAKAVALRPDSIAVRLGHAAQWYRQRNYEGALEAVERLVEAGRADAVAYNFQACILSELGRHTEALRAFESAIQHTPDFAEAQFGRALATLLSGDFERGWALYEWRWKSDRTPKLRPVKAPFWRGDVPLEGHTILVNTEQGLGDAIQFSRYIPLLAMQAKEVIFEVPTTLMSLFDALPENVTLMRKGDPVPACTLQCPLLSLPLAFSTGIDSIPPVWKVLRGSAQGSGSAGQHGGAKGRDLRVGIVWSGNTGHPNDHNRSIPFEQFQVAVEDVSSLVCLQKEIREADRAAVVGRDGLEVVADRLGDMKDTATIIEQLDLVISVDTSVAHLAASMGKPTWILLPLSPDFRWLLNRSDSPWYPSVRLFRQTQAGEWGDVLAEVRKQLAVLMGDLCAEDIRDICEALPTGIAAE